MRKIMMIIICALFLPVAGRAQINLVRNPSFEQYTICPDFGDEAKYCKYWGSLDSSWNPPDWAHDKNGVPEYCNICATSYIASMPYNSRFYHYPRTGNGVMQMQMYVNLWDTSYARDYLQQHLNQTLIAGHSYDVRLYTTLEQASIFACNNIGAYFDDGAIDTTHHPSWIQTQCTPQIRDTSVINDTLNWVKIEDTFTANGTESFMTIGGFFDRDHTDTIKLKPFTSLAATWYLIDDVSVIDCANEPHAGNDTVIHSGDSTFLGSHETLLPYKWYKFGSSTAIDSGSGTWVKPLVTTTYILEQKLCGLTKMDTVKVWVWPDTPNNVSVIDLTKDKIQLHPNPAINELIIDNAANCEITFYDVTGRNMLNKFITADKQAIDIHSLPAGVYVIQIADTSTGLKTTKRILKEQ